MADKDNKENKKILQDNSRSSDGQLVAKILKSKDRLPATLAPPKKHKANHSLKDFSHLGHKVNYLRKQVSKAFKDPNTSNLFIIKGPRKSGRTELIKALHEDMGFDLYIEGWDNPFGKEADRKVRIENLLKRQDHFDDSQFLNTALCIDNFSFEDINRYSDLVRFRKFAYEVTHSDVPIFLVVDDDAKFINSFTKVMRDPKTKDTQGVSFGFRPYTNTIIDTVETFDDANFVFWLKTLNDHGIFLYEDLVRDLSEKYTIKDDIVLREAIQNSLSNLGDQVDYNDVEVAVKGVASVFYGQEKDINNLNSVINNDDLEDYDLRLTNIKSDVDLKDIAQSIVEEVESNKGNPNVGFRLMLLGPSGTGKTAYAKKLGAKIGSNVIETGMSKLNSKFRGQPAKNIEQVFERAQKEKAIVVINEADPLLYPRHSVSEVAGSVVSAFLEISDRYKDVNVILTGNMMGDVDDAAKRRFPIVVKSDYLTQDQGYYAFEYFFDVDLKKRLRGVKSLPSNLTPGDFAGLKDKIKFSVPQSKKKEIVTAKYVYDNIIAVSKEKGDTNTYKNHLRDKDDKTIGFGGNKEEIIEVEGEGTAQHSKLDRGLTP